MRMRLFELKNSAYTYNIVANDLVEVAQYSEYTKEIRDLDGVVVINHPSDDIIREIKKLIEAHPDNPISIEIESMLRQY